jgi:hypothetical protein
MKRILILGAALVLAGCAQWNELSDGEKTGIIIGTSVLVGASIIKNSMQDDSDRICISTRSVETGCGDKF